MVSSNRRFPGPGLSPYPSVVSGTDDLRARVPATAEQLPALRHALDDWAARVGMAAADREALVLASYEAMANVVLHAYDGVTGALELHATHLRHEGRVRVTVVDQGRWRPPPADPGPLHGRGLPIMHAMAAETTVESTDHGTTVRMHWPCPPGGITT